jgi:RNA polymerase sigma-70 factor (ECF subfamily)
MTTDQLIKKCVDRDHAAWDEFIKRYRSLVIRGVRYKLRKLNVRLPREDYNDIVQEIFLFIWEKNKLSGIRDAACVRSWLAMLSVNMTSNYCGRKVFKLGKGAVSLDEELSAQRPGLTLASILPSAKFNTKKTIESNELKEVLEKEISKLNVRQQLALKLNIYDGRTQKDIAGIMNIPENTVASLIKRAKTKLGESMSRYLKE